MGDPGSDMLCPSRHVTVPAVGRRGDAEAVVAPGHDGGGAPREVYLARRQELTLRLRLAGHGGRVQGVGFRV
jgi:hypothetical protein